jgi:hypothetical protein
MTSWLSRTSQPMKQKDFQISSFYEPTTSSYAEDTLHFLYSYAYTQRNANPFYIHDTNFYFQPLLKTSPILHYLREAPSSAINLAKTPDAIATTLQSMSLPALRRTIGSIYQFNGMTNAKVEAFISNFGPLKQTFDAGIVLDASGCVANVIRELKAFQKRTGKASLKVFVATDNLDLLKEFAFTGDKSWSYVSFNRTEPPKDKEAALLKTLSEIRLLQQIPYLVVKFSTALGKLLYLTSSQIQMESQISSIDGSTWKI